MIVKSYEFRFRISLSMIIVETPCPHPMSATTEPPSSNLFSNIPLLRDGIHEVDITAM